MCYTMCKVEKVYILLTATLSERRNNMAKQSTGYKAEYARNHYSRIEFTIPKHAKPLIDAAAAACGEKPTEYVKKAVLQRMGLKEWPQQRMGEEAQDED